MENEKVYMGRDFLPKMSKMTGVFGREMRNGAGWSGINRILRGLKIEGPFSREKKIGEVVEG